MLADEQVDWDDYDADGEVLWALTDHLGSVRDVVDSNGDLRIHRAFDAFGTIAVEEHLDASGNAVTVGQTGYVDTAFAFTGRYFDTDTGLQNNLNRWYDPATGRWISEDPIGFAAGDPNLYRYVGNTPTMYNDPNGLWPRPGSGLANYLHYVNPFVDHHPVDGLDSCLQWGTRAGQGVAVLGGGLAVGLSGTAVGGTVLWGGGSTSAGAATGGGLSYGAQQVLLGYGIRPEAMAALAQLQAIRDSLPRGSEACMRLTHSVDQFEAAILEAFGR